MQKRQWLAAGLVSGLILFMLGCSASEVDTISVTPTTQSLAVGQTAQFTATATTTHGQHPSTTQNVTSLVTWTSSATAVATVSPSGVATAVAPGTATITASMSGFTGNITATATVTVTSSGGSGTSGKVASLTIIPGSQSVASPGQTAQFIAIGTTSSSGTEDLTSQVTWSSSSSQIATITSTGQATAVNQGTATITAVYTNPDNTVATGTATFQVIAATAEPVTALTMYPTAQSVTQSQQTQFSVLGTQGATGLQFDVTSSPSVTWTSSNAAVATVGTSGNGTPGLATGVSSGTTTIEATYTNPDGSKVIATGSYTVSIGAAPEPLVSINIVPAGVTVSNKGMTAQYLAFGTYSTTPTVRDLTDQVTWISLLPEVASIDNSGTPGAIGGLATSQGYTGNSVIYAQLANPDGTVVLSNPQTFTCLDPVTQVCDQGVPHPQFATLTIFVEGENTSPTGEYVTAPSDTGTPNLIHCGPDWTGPGGQVCTGTYETGATIVVTENLPAGSSYFGGWSSGDGTPGVACVPDPGTTLATSTHCTVTLTGNASIGAIFY